MKGCLNENSGLLIVDCYRLWVGNKHKGISRRIYSEDIDRYGIDIAASKVYNQAVKDFNYYTSSEVEFNPQGYLVNKSFIDIDIKRLDCIGLSHATEESIEYLKKQQVLPKHYIESICANLFCKIGVETNWLESWNRRVYNERYYFQGNVRSCLISTRY